MQREISGILIVDKPAGISSAKVVARVKKLLKARKVGHTGTLDPFATGVLICCINRATKLSRFFLHGEKKYEAILRLGIETDSQELTGKVTNTYNNKIEFPEKTIKSVFKQFEGTITQLPPVYSALKYKGVPLYKLARKNKPIQKPARRVSIMSLEVIEINLPTIRFEVSCSAGTYIRTLCADIGASLGCGGHLKELRRTESSGFTIQDAVTMESLETAASSEDASGCMISMSNALKDMPEYVADKMLAQKIRHGNIMTKNDFLPEKGGLKEHFIKVVDADNNLLAILKYTNDNNTYDYFCVFDG